MNHVRKGRGFPVITDEMRSARDKWVLAQCAEVKRLPSKASDLERLLFQLRAGLKQSVESLVAGVLHNIGVSAHIKGYQYLCKAITFTVENIEKIDDIDKELYPKVAADFNTTVSNVKKAMQYAIKKVWDSGDRTSLVPYFGTTIATEGRPPRSLGVYSHGCL